MTATVLDRALLLEELARAGAKASRDVAVLAEVDSTSDELKRRLAAGAGGPGSLVLAAAQTAGRGRLGRSWFSPAAGHLYASLAVAVPGAAAQRVPLVPLAAGVAAFDALVDGGVDGIALKWPNDLLRGGRKIGGVLCEAVSLGATASTLVVGLGVNTGASRFDDELALLAACLGDGGDGVRPERVAARWTVGLEAWIPIISRDGPGPLVAAWTARAEPFGRRVRAGGIEGRTIGLDEAGRLLVERDDGAIATVAGGAVEGVSARGA